MIFGLACVAGGIVGAWSNVLTAEPLKASGEAARRMGRRTLVFLTASPLVMSGSASKILFRAPTIPQATQAFFGYILVLIVFPKGLVRFMEIGNYEVLMSFLK